MSGFVKRLMATGAALTLGISGVAFANFNYDCCPQQPVCCADPCANWCDNITFNAAWLYWKPSGDELDYAVSRVSYFPDTTGVPSTAEERRHNIKGKWNSGFRIGLGATFPSRGWGADVQWTHWDNNSTSKSSFFGATAPSFTSVSFPFFFYGASSLTEGQEAHFRGKLNLNYNVVDIELGKWCCCGDGVLLFKPHFGFRIVDIKEKFHDRLVFSGTSDGLGIDGFTDINFHHRNEFKGAGLRTGLYADLKLCDGWSLLGKGSASAVWGQTHIKQGYSLGTSEQAVDYALDFKDVYRHVRYFADLSVGVQYKTMACGCYPLTFDFAWEFQYLFSQHRPWNDNTFDENPDASNSFQKNGDLSLQGFTLNVAFDF
jgi:hypothetical protein